MGPQLLNLKVADREIRTRTQGKLPSSTAVRAMVRFILLLFAGS